MTAPRAREQHHPASPPDRLPPRRGGRPSSKTESTAGRPADLARPRVARRPLLRSRPALAAAALGALALPATAEAQNCMLNTGDVWCGEVTVGAETSGGATTGHGFSSDGSFGTLTDNSGDQTFTYGTQTYVVSRVVVGVGVFAGELAFRVQRSSPENFVLDDDHRAKLALHVAGSTTPFAFRDTTGYNALLGYVWSNSGLDWSSATTVTVRLRELPDAPTGFEAGVGNAQVGLTWDAPASGANITRHEFRYKTVGSYPTTWTAIATSAPGGTNEASFTVTGLTNEIAHTFELRAVNDSGGGAAAEDGPVTPTPGICGRTAKIQEVILAELTDVTDCAAVTVANLASITTLGHNGFGTFSQGITSLQAGDFAGLTALTILRLANNQLASLPAGIFSGLTAVTEILLDGNQLTALPQGTFANLSNLTGISLEGNDFTHIPAGLFTGVTSLTRILLGANELSSLDAGAFSGLTALERLELNTNELSSLDAGLFTGLAVLKELSLNENDLTRTGLPAGLFSDLTALKTLRLKDNDLSSLPDGLLSGLTNLELLNLYDNPNTGDVLPLTVTVEKVGTDEARAKVLAGAPFAVKFTPTVVNGSLAASDTKLAVAAGSVEGTAETVTRTSGTTETVTVDIDLSTQPSLPSLHDGYEFVRATSGLPAGILSAVGNNAPVFDPATAEREVAENSAAGADVGDPIPEAVDADSGDTLTYSLEGTDARSFAFNASTRQITTKENVTYNYEAKSSYSVRVKASDGTDSATLAVTIGLTDVAEQSARPAKPRLSPLRGSTTSLSARWTRPGLNGGPAITGYDVQYREAPNGTWMEWPHDDVTVTTTITGLTAGRSYQARVRAKNGERDSEWSDPSDVVKTNADASDPLLPPRVTSVVVASAPQSGDTYRSYETIVFTVTFSKPVKVTPGRLRLKVGLDNPGGASGNTVEAVFSGLSQSQRPTADTPQARLAPHMHFEYKVQLFDRDENGVRIGANALRLASEARIQGEGGGNADLDHAAVGPLSGHKVDGRAEVPMIERIDVVSTPRLRSKGTTNRDTYGEGENIRIEVRFDQPVVVEGEPTFALEVGNPCRAVCEADYESGSGTNTLVFAYLVLEVDVDRNGVAIRGNPIEVVSGDSIRNAADQDARLSSKGKGTQRGHKTDGSRAAGPHLSVEDAEAHEADGEMAFTVRLEPHGLGIVTVDYATADGTGSKAARAGSDYTETRGTLRFNPLDTERTVTVPITDDAHEDDGETFTLTLSNPDGAKIRGDDGEATGTIRNSEIQPLTATFEDVPAAHAGADAFTFRVAFSENIGISYRSLREDAFTVTGGRVTGGERVDDRRDLFEMTVEPDGGGAVTVTLPAGRECAVSGAICTKGETRRPLTNTPAATVAGPAAETGPAGLTASFEGMPAAHAGADAFTFRVAFSENIGISYRSLREDAFTVTGGRVTRGKRVDDRRDLFEMTVEPDGGGEVTVTLPAGRECAVSGAICTKGENRRQLTNAPTATVAGPAVAPAVEPLTASFEGMPAEHDGQTAFTLRIAFSEPIRMSGRRLRADVVAVAGGRATKARPVKGRKDRWDLTVKPASRADVTVTLAAGAACDTPAAVCTKAGRALSHTLATTVPGPVALTVADTRAEEGTDETLDFAVSLSRPASRPVRVAYATADGTARAGADYTRTRGTLKFAPGETVKTVRVPVLDDAHDEGEETLTFRLSKASRARLADRVATGTIENTDHLQRAWLARFGRTAATHVTDAVSDRLRGTPGQDSHVTVGGYRLPVGKPGATDGADDGVSGVERLVLALGQRLGLGTGPAPAGAGGVAGAGGWPDAPVATDPRLGQSRTLDVGNALNLRQVLLGSSFRLAFGRDDVGSGWPRLTAWGRVAGTTFDGRDGDLTLNGDVLTGTVGVDGEWDRLLAGLAVAHSRGDGSYIDTEAQGRGDLEQTLTSVHPYLRYAVTDRLAVWGLLGFGTGQVEMELGPDETRETDTNLVMGAFGGRGILLAAAESGGFQLATRTDAMLTRTTSDAVQTADGNMASGDAEAHRLRLVLEGSRGFAWAEGRRLTPTMEVGLRHDWGDAETGFGLELGGRVQYADPALGLTIEAAVRGLLAHEDSDYQEWGASGTVRVAPGAMGQGLSLTLAPAWGATASGVDGLWSRQTTTGLAPNTRRALAGRLNAEVGYGFAPFDTGLLTPYAGTVLSDGADRTYRVGGRLQLGGPGATGLNLNLEGTRQEPAGQQPVNQGLRLQATWTF